MVLRALHVRFSVHFCTFPSRSRLINDLKWPVFIVVWTTWSLDDKFFPHTNLISGNILQIFYKLSDLEYSRDNFKNAKLYNQICSWRSRCCRSRPDVSSAICFNGGLMSTYRLVVNNWTETLEQAPVSKLGHAYSWHTEG